MANLYSVEKVSFTNKKLATVYYSTTGKFIKSSYHRALMSQEQAEKVAAEHGASIKLYAYKHQH
jgi:uncharacterized protein (UPF0303 family)